MTPRLIASDADPGLAPTTTYGAEPTRGLEFGPTGQLDTVSIESGATRVDFHLDVNQPAGDVIDQIRVITIGDPASCPGQATQLRLTPKLAANPVNTQHCVIASVKNATGGPAAGVIVRFDVEGASEQDQSPPDEDASRTTDQNGQAMHCYQGPEMVGADTIHAYADNDRDNVQDAVVEPFDDATKNWLPAAANTLTLEPKADQNIVNEQHCVFATVKDAFLNPVPSVRVRFVVTGTVQKQHVHQTDAAGTAEFCFGAITRGQFEYHDHNPVLPIGFHLINVLVIVCDASGERADIYGTGEVNGVGPVDYRIRVHDGGEPGSTPGPDTYQIITTAYTSGPEENPLQGGNIQIHRFR